MATGLGRRFQGDVKAGYAAAVGIDGNRNPRPADRLPIDGVKRFFRFRDPQGGLIGFIGIEQGTDSVALLRSLVVIPSARRQGWGVAIARWALDHLTERGVSNIWLIATDTEWLSSPLETCQRNRVEIPCAGRTAQGGFHGRQVSGPGE